MSRPQFIVCDGPGCGKQKQAANHWWSIQLNLRSPGEMRLLPGTTPDVVGEEKWKYLDFCGQTCAIKFISEQMSKVEDAKGS